MTGPTRRAVMARRRRDGGLADELPGAPGHVEVSWQAGDPQYIPF